MNPEDSDTEKEELVPCLFHVCHRNSTGIPVVTRYDLSVKLQRHFRCCYVLVLLAGTLRAADPNANPVGSASDTTLAHLISELRHRAKTLENTSGMRSSFQSFTSAYKISPDSISYSDFVIVRLLYEATRDAGFWNMHWTITNMPPDSDQVRRQWKTVQTVSPLTPTASAECDELSALYAFLVERAGVRTVGLFWPYPNHTVAVWVIHPTKGAEVRVVVPTSQVFLTVNDSFATRKFNAWHQRTIFEYKRRDAPDSFELPKPLFDFFLAQIGKYAGASDSTLQQLRYLREGVFLKDWGAETAAKDALDRKTGLGSGPAEDVAAFQNFASDMRAPTPH